VLTIPSRQPLSRLFSLAVAFAFTASAAHGQATPPSPPATRGAPPRPADVASTQAIVNALYDVISGPAGPRNWERFTSLFFPGARLIQSQARPDGTINHRVFSVEEYARLAGPGYMANAFFEREISRKEDRFGAVAHVFSTYDSKRAPSDTLPFSRGINSIQLAFDGSRWAIVNVIWDAERAGLVIPDQYLGGNRARRTPAP
jgi:hypothetical protein